MDKKQIKEKLIKERKDQLIQVNNRITEHQKEYQIVLERIEDEKKIVELQLEALEKLP